MIRRADLRFAYRLAAHLGEEDPEAMLERMPASRLARWEAYFLLEPFGSDVDDHRAGQIAATVANCNRGKNQKPFRPDDFFPSRIPKPAPSIDDQIHAMFRPLAAKGEG